MFSPEEIYQTSKENIEGFATILKHFMLAMNITNDDPCIINVEAKADDQDGENPYFKATAAFNKELMYGLEKRFDKLKTITAKVDFDKYSNDDDQLEQNLCPRVFNNLGIQEIVYC